MSFVIKEAKRAESLTRKRDLAAARRVNLDGSALALAEHCRGLPDAPIRFDAVKPYPLQPHGDGVDDR